MGPWRDLQGGFRVRLVALAASLTLIACNSGQPAPGPDARTGTDQPGSAAPGVGPDSNTAVGVDRPAPAPAGGGARDAVPSSCDNLHDEILRLPPTREALRAEFGPPDSISRDAEPNRHVAGAIDSLFTVYYPGLVADMRTPAGARDMATRVRIENNRYLAYPGIGIGVAADRVEQVLGPPHERAAGYLRYQCSEAVEQPVTFRLTSGRVDAIEIDYYVD